jgi:hypothetical protein
MPDQALQDALDVIKQEAIKQEENRVNAEAKVKEKLLQEVAKEIKDTQNWSYDVKKRAFLFRVDVSIAGPVLSEMLRMVAEQAGRRMHDRHAIVAGSRGQNQFVLEFVDY